MRHRNEDDTEEWRKVLLGTHPQLAWERRLFERLPSDPRCSLCRSPYGGVGGMVLRFFGYGRYARNPQLCNNCFRHVRKHPGGAEVQITVLFADVRGSTTLAEGMTPSEFSGLLSGYYRIATDAVRETGGLIDKLLGDGVLALFIPGFAGERHAARAIEAARTILARAELPIGAGVHTDEAWLGFVGGSDEVLNFTALGDAVNTASRLSSEAASGELLISSRTAALAETPTDGLQARHLRLRGRDEPLDVWSERFPAHRPSTVHR
jgi:adenylate cyclase